MSVMNYFRYDLYALRMDVCLYVCIYKGGVGGEGKGCEDGLGGYPRVDGGCYLRGQDRQLLRPTGPKGLLKVWHLLMNVELCFDECYVTHHGMAWTTIQLSCHHQSIHPATHPLN